MVEAEGHVALESKRKAITALLPHAVWQERDGQPEMLDTILRAAGASRMPLSMHFYVNQFISTLFSEASPRAIILVLPHFHWDELTDRGDLVQWWAAMASTVPYTEEVAQSVVGTLLRIASKARLVQYIPANLWSWLTKQPSLPPGHPVGTNSLVVNVVWALKDIEVFKSYLVLIWSEWNTPWGCNEMCTSIREDFSGIGMGKYRAKLIRRLDHVLGQLDCGLEHLRQYSRHIYEFDLRVREGRYQKLRETLLEIDSRTPHLIVMPLHVLTLTWMRTGSRTTFMCALPPLCP